MLHIKDLRTPGYFYLASPYSSYHRGIDGAFEDVCRVAGELLQEGVHVYCPIAHTHPIAKHGGLDPYSHALFLPIDEKMMEHAVGCLVVKMPGYDRSIGVRHEIEFFQKRHKPVFYLSWPVLRIVQDRVAA